MIFNWTHDNIWVSSLSEVLSAAHKKKIFNVDLFLSFCFVEPPPDDDDDQDGYLEPGCEYTIFFV